MEGKKTYNNLTTDEKFLVYNSVIMPSRILKIPEILSNQFSPFFDIFYEGLTQNPCLKLLTIEKFGTIQETLKKWMTLQKDELIEPSNLELILDNLSPGESFPVFIKSQNCCLIFNERKDEKSDSSISGFQVSASNQEITEKTSQLYLRCPQIVVKVQNEKLLKSKEFIKLISDLANNRNEVSLMYSKAKQEFFEETNDVDLPVLIFNWILPMLSERNAPSNDRAVLVKKYQDFVVFVEDQFPFRRNSVWTCIKAFFHLTFIERLGHELGKMIYKSIILKVHLVVSEFFQLDCFEILFECLMKTAKRIKKLEDLFGQNQLIQSLCNQGKDLINFKRQESEKLYLEHVLSSNQFFNRNVFKFENFNSLLHSDMKELINQINQMYSQRDIFQHQGNPEAPKYKRLKFQGKLPETGIFRNCEENELNLLLLEFEIWAKKKLELRSTTLKENEISVLFELLNDYVLNSSKVYEGDPVSYSKLILTSFKLVAIIDKSTREMYHLLNNFKIGLETSSFTNLLLPTLDDVEYANELIQYYKTRNEAKGFSLLTLPNKEENSLNNFNNRYVELNKHCKILKKILIEHQEKEIEAKLLEADSMIMEYQKKLIEYESMLCKNVFKDNIIEHDALKCTKCYIFRCMRRMELDVYEKFLPENSWEIDLLVFELCIPKAVACFRDSIFLVRSSALGLRYEGKQVQGIWTERFEASSFFKNYQKLVKLGSSAMSTKKGFRDTRKISYNQEPSRFIVNCGFNLELCSVSKTIQKWSSQDAETRKNCIFKLLGKFEEVQWVLDRKEIFENDVIAQVNKCPMGITLNEFRSFCFFRAGEQLILLRLLEALETRNLPFREPSTCYLISQSLWESGLISVESSQPSVVYPETQNLFSNELYLNQLFSSLKGFFENNQHNWGEHLLAYTVVIIAQRFINFCRVPSHKERMIVLLKEIRKVLMKWQEKLENLIEQYQDGRKLVKSNLRTKLFQIACISLMTFCLDSEYFELIMSDNYDFYCYFKSFNRIRNLIVGEMKVLNHFDKFLYGIVNRFCLGLENNLCLFVRRHKGRPLVAYLETTGFKRESGKVVSYRYSNENYGFFLDYVEPQDVKTEIFIGLEGQFLVNGLAYTRLPDFVINNDLYQSYFKNVDFTAYGINNAYETAPKMFNESLILRFQFKILDNLFENKLKKVLLVKEFMNGPGLQKVSIMLHESLFYNLLPKYFIDNFSHWLNIEALIVEFRGKTYEKFNSDQPAKYFLDIRTKMMFENGTTRVVILLNSLTFKVFYDQVFHRLEEKDYIHLFYDKNDKNFNIELPRHSLNFVKQVSSTEILSKEYAGYMIASSQNIKTLFGISFGIVLEGKDNKKYLKKKLIIPNATFKIEKADESIHQVISHDFSVFNTPSFFTYELDKRLQIIKGEESIESWLFLAYLHGITSSTFPDPFLGRQGTARSLEILQSGHCFTCSPLSKESKRILSLISGLSPKRKKVSRQEHKIEMVVWVEGLSSMAASDQFILICSEILEKNTQLSFLYKSSYQGPGNEEDPEPSENLLKLEKSLYIKSCLRETREDFKLTDSFRNEILMHQTSNTNSQSSFIGIGCRWSNSDVINVRKISTKSYSPKKLDLLKDFRAVKNFKGRSIEPLDYTQMTNLVSACKDFPNHWIDLYLFVQSATEESVMIVLTGLAYLDVNLNHLLLFQKVFYFPELTQDLEVMLSDKYSNIEECSYVEEQIVNILKKNILIDPKDNFQNLKKNLGEKNAQFESRVMAQGIKVIDGIIKIAESEIRSQWPNRKIVFQNEKFSIIDVKEDVKSQFLHWLKHRELKKLLNHLGSNVKKYKYKVKNIELESESLFPQVPLETSSFSLKLDSQQSKKLNESPYLKEIIKIYNNGPILNESLMTSLKTSSQSSLYEFPFKTNESSSSLEFYFVSDLKQSWDHHISTLNSQTSYNKVPDIKRNLEDLATLYKLKSKTLLNIFKNCVVPESSKYLSSSFLLSSYPSSSVLTHLRSHHDRKLVSDMKAENLMEALCGAICIYWALEQRILRCLYFYSLGSSQELSLYRELETVPFSNWRPKDYPLWLILQVETDMMIRPVQVSVAESMINPSSQKNTVMQLNMGEGKTSLIIPMVVLVLANKSQLVRLTVLKSLFNTNKAALVFKLGGCLNRRIYSIPCKREIKFNVKNTTLINLLLKQCLTEQGVFLTLPDQRFSFILKGMELSRVPETAAAGNHLLTIQSRLDEKCRDLLDESDEILNPKYQLIYTIGKQNTVQCGSLRWNVSQGILETMLEHLQGLYSEFPNSVVYERFMKTPQRFPLIRLTNDEPYHKLCKLVAGSILRGSCTLISLTEIKSEENFDLVFRYITSESLTQEHFQQVSNLFKTNPSQFDVVILLKGILSCQILLSCLIKRWRVNYGVNTRNAYLMQAVPFRAKDVPADKSQFAHPDIAILLTQLSYFYSGLNESQLDQVFKRLDHDPDGGREYESWVEDLAGLTQVDASIRTFKGINLNDKQQKLEILFPLFKFNQTTINYWLNHFLYPKEAKQFEGKLSLSFWDLCIQKPFPMTGFSGTNDSKILLPLTVDNYDVPGLIGTNGSLIYNLLRPENSRYAYFKANVSGPELLEQVSREVPKINVLLDVGALMLELTNQQVIQEWLKIRKDAKAGVCFDDSNNLVVLSRSGQVVPFEISPFRNHLNDCLVYLDDSHTRGTDLKIPKGTFAAVTLGKGVNKDKLMQGCMRMRMLGKGHCVMFFASSEVHKSIQSTTRNNPSGFDVLNWSLKNTISQTSENFLYWGLQGISYFKRQVLYEKYFKSKDFKTFSTYSEEPEIPDIRLLYGRNRKETAIPSIIKSKSSIIQNQLKSLSVDLGRFGELCQSLISHSSDFVKSEKKFAHLLDEEQELELEIEVEVEAEVEMQKLVVVEAERHSLEKDIKIWFQTGEVPQKSLVFHQVFKGLGITSLKKISQPFAWSSKVWLTLDFMRTVSIVSGGDHYLKPVRWLGFSGTLRNPKSLVVLSSFEANALMKEDQNGPVKLFLYCPRLRSSQINLFGREASQIPLHLIQNLNAFAGNQFFFSQNEIDEFLRFVGYCPTPRKIAEQKFYSMGMIHNNGYVEPKFRNQVFGDTNLCDFDADPAELLLKIIDIRNFSITSKFGHVVDILVHGKRPELRR